jgi:hypothetical protein
MPTANGMSVELEVPTVGDFVAGMGCLVMLQFLSVVHWDVESVVVHVSAADTACMRT